MINQKTTKYLRDRFKILSQKAIDLKAKIDTAKTQFKKDYYGKKLKKINEEALDVLLLINSSQELVQQSTTAGKTEFPTFSIPLKQEDEHVIED